MGPWDSKSRNFAMALCCKESEQGQQLTLQYSAPYGNKIVASQSHRLLLGTAILMPCQNTDYAVKFVRSNFMMRRAAEKEARLSSSACLHAAHLWGLRYCQRWEVETYRRLAKLVPKEDQEARVQLHRSN